jgi:hypothetical protein
VCWHPGAWSDVGQMHHACRPLGRNGRSHRVDWPSTLQRFVSSAPKTRSRIVVHVLSDSQRASNKAFTTITRSKTAHNTVAWRARLGWGPRQCPPPHLHALRHDPESASSRRRMRPISSVPALKYLRTTLCSVASPLCSDAAFPLAAPTLPSTRRHWSRSRPRKRSRVLQGLSSPKGCSVEPHTQGLPV